MSDSFPAPEGAFSTEPPKAKDAPIPVVKLADRQRTPPAWRHYLLTALLAAVVAAFVAVVISVGVNVLFWGSAGAGGRLNQDGRVKVGAGIQEVFYPIPFAGPPNLVLEGGFNQHQLELKEQKADHFTIINNVQFPYVGELRWKAEGIRGEK